MSKVVIYTPTYWRSPGTQYRIDMLLESLTANAFKTQLVVGRESALRALYRRLSSMLLDKRKVWDVVGKEISRSITRLKPDYAILIHDVTACASKYLEKENIKTVVSVEDLTTRYVPSIRKNAEKAKRINAILCECLQQAWKVITPSYTLTDHLSSMCGVEAVTVPVGLKPFVSYEEAINRPLPVKIAHTRWLKHPANYAELLSFIQARKDVTFLVHSIGSAKRIREPNVVKYRFDKPQEAIPYLSQAHYGLIVELSDHYTLSTFYYHMALLQPIIGKLNERLKTECSFLGVPIHNDIPGDYEKEVRILANHRVKHQIPLVHNELIKWLKAPV